MAGRELVAQARPNDLAAVAVCPSGCASGIVVVGYADRITHTAKVKKVPKEQKVRMDRCVRVGRLNPCLFVRAWVHRVTCR